MEGWLNDHIQLQPVVDVAADGKTARARSRELGMTGKVGGQGPGAKASTRTRSSSRTACGRFQSLHFYPTFITDYDKGWAKDAQPVPVASTPAAAGSSADGNVRDLSEGARSAVSLSQSCDGQGADVSDRG